MQSLNEKDPSVTLVVAGLGRAFLMRVVVHGRHVAGVTIE
jgi:hypothetical protein